MGAICGVGVVKGFGKTLYMTKGGGGTNVVADGYTKGDALGAEIVGTSVLVYTVFSASDAKHRARDTHIPILAPLPIRFAMFLVHLATIPIIDTSINRARSLGAANIYNKEQAWDDHWIFWVVPYGFGGRGDRGKFCSVNMSSSCEYIEITRDWRLGVLLKILAAAAEEKEIHSFEIDPAQLVSMKLDCVLFFIWKIKAFCQNFDSSDSSCFFGKFLKIFLNVENVKQHCFPNVLNYSMLEENHFSNDTVNCF
ncbi:uncharacterized protein LOC111393085 [Olea europaea var. sylvestris]|uniref:uncharacterized protein LOC111393085 n=1 Tax=Olea europaea var. sylvestris TaxID=158386 RepID=UPI000C1D4E32|nr:uncharacterized protein LOC111393085 [Olea europaea var. sylvestris]